MCTGKNEESLIDVGRLLRFDTRSLTLIPCLMILSVVINASVDINLLEFQTLSYMVLATVLLSFATMSFLYFRQRVVSWFVIVVVIYEFLLLTFTLINGNNIKSCFYEAGSVIFIVMACDYYKERYQVVIAAFAIAFSLCVYLNFVHLISHPELWIIEDMKSGRGYLLGGNYNQIGSRLLCAVGTSVMCLKYSKWWVLNVIPVTIISISTLVIVGSMTSLTGILLFLLFCLIPSNKLLKTGIITLIGFVMFFQIFVCFQGKGLEQNPIALYFIEDVLGKDITFTNRTYLWDAAARLFTESPIYGYGFVDSDWYYSRLSSAAKGPHNFIWNIILLGGITLLALFTYICYLVFAKLPYINERYILYIYALISVLFLMMTMEVYPTEFIFTLLSLAYFAFNTLPEQISETSS